MEIPCGITIQSEAFLGEKQNYCLYTHPFFLQQTTQQRGKRHSMLFFTHKITHYDNVGKLTTDISYCLKRLITVLMVTDKICHIIQLGPKFPMRSIQTQREMTKRKSQFFITCFFLFFLFAIHSFPLLTHSNTSEASAEYKSSFSSVKYDNL